ncbi:GNAT family N-acetyltransferase [Streptomyces sp. Je 1-79]|uniref:GNAT family N-acetyltransferase n=1 Tax=Streptomyces sp. Je 1-79 TaxID=2943847 RepID=UPI0021A476E6|nr:GNAT family N-acetyltransferase [Streptomyces sp. Je 1-79]MCT4356756.1 GNAT family N-acetyltransferase [Streptomyces sp. Je 1-79]
MTTTLRPAEPLQQTADGGRSRTYDVCVNSRRVGSVRLATAAGFGARAGVIADLGIDEKDRRRGRGTVAALAAEEVLRGWGCGEVQISVPSRAEAALRMARVLGYTERGRNMAKELPAQPPALPPGVEVRPMTAAEFVVWEAKAKEGYARSWIERGVPADQARAKAEASHRELLPQGLDSPGVAISVAVRDGATVGQVWTAARDLEPGVSGSYVYDIEVAEAHRGQGYGRALMLVAERVALGAGERLLGLHVFTGNTPAIRLYESLGYRTTYVNSYKALL